MVKIPMIRRNGMNGKLLTAVMISVFLLSISVAVAGNGPGGQKGGPQTKTDGASGGEVQQNQRREQNQQQNTSRDGSGDQLRTRDRDRDREREQKGLAGDEGDNLKLKKRERMQEQTRVENHVNTLFYIDQDGEMHQWRLRYNKRLRKFEEAGDGEAMNNYLHRIANQYRFKNKKDNQRFVVWARKNKPWSEQ
jgi:hypothetical protein